MSVKESLKVLMVKKEYTQGKIAVKTGLSKTVISQYLSDSYKGNIKNVEDAINNLLRREEERERSMEVKSVFVKTRLAAKCLTLVRNMHLDSDIGVLYGSAGAGKSITLRQYAHTYSDTILIEADPGYTAKVLLQELCERLGVGRRGNVHDLTERCINALKDTGWLIIVDEAELLPHKALETLRRVHDLSGVGIVLAGMPRLLINLKGSRGEFEQLYSRVGMALDMDKFKAQTEREDFDAVLASLLPGFEGVDAAVANAFYKGSRGSYRRLFKLARGVVRASSINSQGISVELVNEYSEMLIK
jgi:DNA transposition AAA+ family ATPase